MGSFSWCYCDTGKIRRDKYVCPAPKRDQRLVGYSKDHPASVLFPKEFGGKGAQIDVDMYMDYGRFNSADIYDLVADWNRGWIAAHPEYIGPHEAKHALRDPEHHQAKRMNEMSWWAFYSDLSLSREDVVRKWREATGAACVEYRQIGIDIAHHDEDNAALMYPIKIARNKESVYEDCPPSLNDPYQGFD